jgi:hypothetical protein
MDAYIYFTKWKKFDIKKELKGVDEKNLGKRKNNILNWGRSRSYIVKMKIVKFTKSGSLSFSRKAWRVKRKELRINERILNTISIYRSRFTPYVFHLMLYV